MKIKLLIIVLVLLSGCEGNIYSERLKNAIEFCQPYGGIYKLRIDSTLDGWDRVHCFDQRKSELIDNLVKIKK